MLGLLDLPLQHGDILPSGLQFLQAAPDPGLHLVQFVLETAHGLQSGAAVHAPEHGVGLADELGPACFPAQLARGCFQLLDSEALLEEVDGALGAVDCLGLVAGLLVGHQSVFGLG